MFDFCRFCVVIRFFHPRQNGRWPPTSKDFLSQILSVTFIFLSKSLRKSQYFPFECSVLNKGTTGTILITSLVCRGSWLEIEPGTSRTRSQHYTTRLSRRRSWLKIELGTSRTRSQHYTTRLSRRRSWLGIELGTSRTRSQHYTTRLSRRRSLTGDWTRYLPHSKPALYH